MQCKDIPDKPILEFLAKQDRWATYGEGFCMPTVADAMPENIPVKLQRAKMAQLIKRHLADGCTCGCRGDFQITYKGRTWLEACTIEATK